MRDGILVACVVIAGGVGPAHAADLLRNDQLSEIRPLSTSLAAIFTGAACAGGTTLDAANPSDCSETIEGEGALEPLPGSDDRDDLLSLDFLVPALDPGSPLLVDLERPLIFWQLDSSCHPNSLQLTKDRTADSVMLHESCPVKRVFLTSIMVSPNFGGLPEGDEICNDLAEAAGLPRDFLAWLSDGTDSPSTRFDTSFTGDYVMLNRARSVVANGWADLTDGSLDNALQYDERGRDSGVGCPTSYGVWTGTDDWGYPSGFDCAGWTDDTDASRGTRGTERIDCFPTSSWTYEFSGDCGLASTPGFGVSKALYCFER